MRVIFTFLSGILLLIIFSFCAGASTPAEDQVLLAKAYQAQMNYWGSTKQHRYVTLIDYSCTILSQRLWAVDTEQRRVVLRSRVAHAWNSGLPKPYQFSNKIGREQSSLGTFVTAEASLSVSLAILYGYTGLHQVATQMPKPAPLSFTRGGLSPKSALLPLRV